MKTKLLTTALILAASARLNAQTSGEVETNAVTVLRFADDMLEKQAKFLLDTSVTLLDALNGKTDHFKPFVSGMKNQLERIDLVLNNFHKLKKPVSYSHGGDRLSADTATIRKKTDFAVFCCTVALGSNELTDMLTQFKWQNFHTLNSIEDEKYYGRVNMAGYLASDAENILKKIDEIEMKPYAQLIEVFYDGHYYTLAELRKNVSAVKDFANKTVAEIKKAEEARIAPYKKALGENSDKFTQWKYYIGPRGCCWGPGGVKLCTPEELSKNSRWFFYSTEETLIGPFWTLTIVSYSGTKETGRDTRTGFGKRPPNNQFR